MDDYELRSKLDAIKNQEQRIADSLDRMERGPTSYSPGFDKMLRKIIVGLFVAFFGLSTVAFLVLMILSFFI